MLRILALTLAIFALTGCSGSRYAGLTHEEAVSAAVSEVTSPARALHGYDREAPRKSREPFGKHRAWLLVYRGAETDCVYVWKDYGTRFAMRPCTGA